MTARAGAARAGRDAGPARARRAVPEGIRVTRVGLFYILFAVLVGVAATNTGNNALYMVLAVMLALLGVSGLVSRDNVRCLEVALAPPEELFAHQRFRLGFTLSNRSRFRPRWLLLLWVGEAGAARLVAYLPAGGFSRGALDLVAPRRGPLRLSHAHLASIFPLGLFRKGMRHRLDVDLLVFPQLLEEPPPPLAGGGRVGEEGSRRRGWGHELLGLRGFRAGDDPRAIHWKQTARTGQMIVTEREIDEGRRLSVVLDNAVAPHAVLDEARFERLVSAAATAACHYLERGFEVELVTRDELAPFAAGPRQRRRVLELLALVAPAAGGGEPLAGRDPRVPQLRFELEAAR